MGIQNFRAPVARLAILVFVVSGCGRVTTERGSARGDPQGGVADLNIVSLLSSAAPANCKGAVPNCGAGFPTCYGSGSTFGWGCSGATNSPSSSGAPAGGNGGATGCQGVET